MAIGDTNRLRRSRSKEVSEIDAVMLFAADLRTVLLLVNETRYRTLERVFGVPRDQANLVTLIALAALVQAAHDRANAMVHAPGGPTRTDGVLGGAVVEELLRGVGGLASRTTPFLAAIILVGLLHGRSRPLILKGMTGLGKGWRNLHQLFEHHYRQRVEPTSVGRALTAAREAVGDAVGGT